MKILIVGAGLSGSVTASQLIKEFNHIDLIDKRNHIGGNCYTYEEDGIIIHKYGPHIFHTNNEKVWGFINDIIDFEIYINRVKSIYKNQVYSLPINLHTINQFYSKSFNPLEAKTFIETIRLKKNISNNFEDRARSLIGDEMYQAFLYGYTKKQWGREPSEIPDSVLKRLPMRFSYDDNYYDHKYQGMPVNGYTEFFTKILSNKKINLNLGVNYEKSMYDKYDHIIFTGPIDEFFNYKFGELEYRSLVFEKEKINVNDFQGNPVINYSDYDIPYTRITEHKHFHSISKENNKDSTIIFKEYSRNARKNDEKYYPVKLNSNNLIDRYFEHALKQSKVSFIGRLGTYSYLDMDVTIEKSLDFSERFIKSVKEKKTIPVF